MAFIKHKNFHFLFFASPWLNESSRIIKTWLLAELLSVPQFVSFGFFVFFLFRNNNKIKFITWARIYKQHIHPPTTLFLFLFSPAPASRSLRFFCFSAFSLRSLPQPLRSVSLEKLKKGKLANESWSILTLFQFECLITKSTRSRRI